MVATRESAARSSEYTCEAQEERALYLAVELSKSRWLLGFTVGLGQKARRRWIAAGDLGHLSVEIARAKARFGLGEQAPVIGCYEVGREGFFPYWALVSLGVEMVPVASTSIEVKRGGRRAKTDRLDVGKLLTMLVRYHLGESKVWSVVRVPSETAEDLRHLHRERSALQHLRTQESNRIRSLLATQGIELEGRIDERLDPEALRRWDGSALGPMLILRLKGSLERLRGVDAQLAELDALRRSMLAQPEAFPEHQAALEMMRRLQRLKGVGMESSWLLVAEFLAWRQFDNRKQIAGAAGLCATPYDSGQSRREQGIGHGGHAWVRPMMIELAWLWRRWQPGSRLARWFEQRWGPGSSRQRKVGIVAVARKLLIALWRFAQHDELPEGAVLKAR